MTIRQPRATAPTTRRSIAPGAGVAALRRRAATYREKADALEAMLKGAQDHFTDAFAVADSQVSTRERIAEAARRGRRLGARSGR